MKNRLKIWTLFIFIGINWHSFGQGFVQGTFPELANQPIQLLGYNGFDTYLIKSVRVNDRGEFIIDYLPENNGAGLLQSEDEKQFLLLLNSENVVLNGIDLKTTDAVKIIESTENQFFDQYMNEHMQREQTMAGWDYLKRIYQSKESFFSKQTAVLEHIQNERSRIQKEDRDFLAQLPKDSYVYWYLPIRKLISSVSTIAQYRVDEIPETTDAFRKIDYSDNRLYKSGLLNDVLENQVWFIENSGYGQDEMYQQMSVSIDSILASIVTNEKLYNEIVERLFKILEKRSLYQASEYLALKVLNEKNCTLNNDLANQLEHYRAMKIGNTVPDIDFKGDLITLNSEKKIKRLSDIPSKYTVLFFGASWCPSCQEEIPQLLQVYNKWKSQDVEVVFISLDEDKQSFSNFTNIFPFPGYCDYQKWESPVVKDYHVFATPTFYLLDENRKIILRPNSVSQMDSWVDWYLIQGDK
ncbi:MAG: TlpA disulfide reductase family protein [Bacteroidales bacterium]